MKKVIVITGGSEGLGKVIAQELNDEHTVVILSHSEEKLKNAAQEIGCDYELCDVSDYTQIENAFNSVLAKHERIDCLINNAGIWIQDELDTNDPEKIKRVIEVNTLGTIYGCRAAVPIMKKQNGGRIMNVISQAGLYAKTERTVYNSSKWALTGFTRSLDKEVSKYNIGVYGLYPSFMNTNMFANFRKHTPGGDRSMDHSLDPRELAKTIKFALTLQDTTVFTEIGIKNIEY